MHTARWSTLVASSLMLAVTAFAQVDGPMPLAWRWYQPTSTAPSGSPMIEGDRVYVAVGSRMFALDRTTGNKLWQYPLIEPIDGHFRSSPIMIDGTLVASADNRTVYGVNATSGEGKWAYTAPSTIIGQPVLAGKYVIINLNAESVMAINSEDGQPVWENPQRIFDGIKGNLAGQGSGLYFFTQRNELYRMNVSTKKSDRLVRFSNVSSDVTPVFGGDGLYVNSGSFVAALNPSTGSSRWQQNVRQDLILGPAVSVDGVTVVTRDGDLLLLDATGRQRTIKDGNKVIPMPAVQLGSMPIAPPTAVGKFVVVPTMNGAIQMIDTSTGELVWSYTIKPVTAGLKGANGQPIISIPAAGPVVVSGNALYVLSRDGSLLSFDKEMGADLTGPTVKMGWPPPSSIVPGKGLELAFLIADEASGINEKSLKITVNGEPVVHEFGRDGVAVVRYTTGSKNRELGDGRASIVVTVSDWLGNQTSQNFA
ncbi:MAG TPA: PQQ-binding-like beta-propeller repeat protein, partial [Fimbriimonadaceae bacterium]|nr:PQQ-binding-like beta-propeller repeat protein [Fimbriimonadaceae bacterium]